MFCYNCGRELPANANFCICCGVRLKDAAAAPPQQAELFPPEATPPPAQTEPQPPARIAPAPSPPPLPSPEPLAAIDTARAIRAIFEDPKWLQKMLLGGVVLVIPFVGFLIILPGYGLQIVNRVVRGAEHPLPEWNIGKCLNKGGTFFIYYFSLFVGAMIVLRIVQHAFSSLHLLADLYGIFAILAMSALWVYMLAAYAFVGAEDNPAAIFHFGRILDAMIDNPVPLLVVFTLDVASLFLALSGVIGLYVCFIFTASLSAIFMSHIAGQFYRVAHTNE